MKWVKEPNVTNITKKNEQNNKKGGSPLCVVNCSTICGLDFHLPCICGIKTCHGTYK